MCCKELSLHRTNYPSVCAVNLSWAGNVCWCDSAYADCGKFRRECQVHPEPCKRSTRTQTAHLDHHTPIVVFSIYKLEEKQFLLHFYWLGFVCGFRIKLGTISTDLEANTCWNLHMATCAFVRVSRCCSVCVTCWNIFGPAAFRFVMGYDYVESHAKGIIYYKHNTNKFATLSTISWICRPVKIVYKQSRNRLGWYQRIHIFQTFHQTCIKKFRSTYNLMVLNKSIAGRGENGRIVQTFNRESTMQH